MNDFMEGIDPLDYCEECGTLLDDVVVMPNGDKRVIAHIVNSEECIRVQSINKEMLEESN